MILIDTSVWVGHLRQGDDRLAELLLAGEVACHAFVIGELACGRIRNRDEVLALLSALPTLAKADDPEVLDFIERHHLAGTGLGLIDIHLLASCMTDGAALWTQDKKLAATATRLGCAAGPGTTNR